METESGIHPFKRWEVSIMKLEEERKAYYKVTRRLAELSVPEIKLFDSKRKAKQQCEEWLDDYH